MSPSRHQRQHLASVMPAFLCSLCLIPLIFVVTACQPTTTSEAALQATVASLSTENAALASALTATPTSAATVAASVAATAAPATPVPAAAPAPLPTATQAPPSASAPAAELSRLPRVVAQVALAPDDATLRDLAIDRAGGRIYVTDIKNTLYVLDAASLAVQQTLPVSGALLTLDSTNQRLYIAPVAGYANADNPPQISIFDTASQSLLPTTISGGRIAVDRPRNRLYVGELGDSYTAEPQTTGVRLIDGTSLAVLATSDTPGVPAYNPLRDELLIASYTAYSADPTTLAIRSDLLPEFKEQPFAGCTGCDRVNDIIVFPDEQVVVLDLYTIATGGGPGLSPPPRLLDANTLQPLAESPLVFARSCGAHTTLRPPSDGRIYRSIGYTRYVTYFNLTVSDLNGKLLSWLDGLPAPFILPSTSVAIAQGYGDTDIYALDLATLTPLGRLPLSCIFEADPTGLIYGFWDGTLQVWATQGGDWQPAAAASDQLAGNEIAQILLSPNFARDNTLYVRAAAGVSGTIASGEGVLRSRDGGATWQRLFGGLPAGNGLRFKLAFSPDFAADQTLFAAGGRGEYAGDGVWRSSDGGDSWQPMWNGLTHLRVYDLALSPRFKSDRTLLAYAQYNFVQPWDSGASLFRSTDAGVSWTRVMTAPEASLLPSPLALLPAMPAPELPVRKVGYLDALQYTLDGSTWLTVTNALGQNRDLLALLPAPGQSQPRAFYAVVDDAVWRTQDGGLTWQVWDDERLAGRDYASRLTAAAITPLAPDDSYRLLIGSGIGELWQLDPGQMSWREVAAAPPAVAAAAAALPTPTLAPAATATIAPLSGEPPAGFFRPAGMFGSQWEGNAGLQQALGWASSEQPSSVQAAAQAFEHGDMIWRSDTKEILVIFQDDSWLAYKDTFVEGQAEVDHSLVVPAGVEQPMRGFGKVWRENATVRERIGWALAKEQPTNITVHAFQHGQLIRVGGMVYALLDDGTWQ